MRQLSTSQKCLIRLQFRIHAGEFFVPLLAVNGSVKECFQYPTTLRGDAFDLALDGHRVTAANWHIMGLLIKVRFRKTRDFGAPTGAPVQGEAAAHHRSARACCQTLGHRIESAYSHIERIALTLFGLTLLCFPLTRRASPTWTKCVLVAAAAACVVELLFLW
jgi:hypothetical protein